MARPLDPWTQNLRARLRETHRSQEWLAQKCGVTLSAAQNWARGISKPRAKHLAIIEAELGPLGPLPAVSRAELEDLYGEMAKIQNRVSALEAANGSRDAQPASDAPARAGRGAVPAEPPATEMEGTQPPRKATGRRKRPRAPEQP